MQGGADQGLPVIVSKVASGTPADLCIPRLNEGDQVLFINGRDISSLTHEQVNSAYSLANSCTPVVFCISSVTFFSSSPVVIHLKVWWRLAETMLGVGNFESYFSRLDPLIALPDIKHLSDFCIQRGS